MINAFNSDEEQNGKRSNSQRHNHVSAQSILDSLAENVCVVDAEGIIVAVNAAWEEFAQSNNYSASQSDPANGMGRNYLSICQRAVDQNQLTVAEEIAAGLNDVIRGKSKRYTKEYPCHSPTKQRWFLVTISPLRNAHKGAVISHLNITESYLLRENLQRQESEVRRLNSELEERVSARTRDLQIAFEELETFSYSVSHDLRSPLRSINGYVSILLEDYGDRLDEVGRGYIQRIQTIVGNSAELINALVELAGMSRYELENEEVDLREIVHVIADELREENPNRQVDLTMDGDLKVKGDRRMLGIVLENLLQNAWKFTRNVNPGKIRITGRRIGGEVRVAIADNGIGFDNDHRRLLFKPFQRLVSSDQFKGNGIGLATVEKIIRRHGGSVQADGTLNKGATFSFTLPNPD